MNILLTRRLVPVDLEYIKKALDRMEIKNINFINPDSFDEKELLERIVKDKPDVFFGPFVTENMIKMSSNLKLIQIPWSGLDMVNFKALKNFNGKVANSHSNSVPVAEFGIGLMLDMIKKISLHNELMKNGDANRGQRQFSVSSDMIAGKTVGIMGYGAIGSNLARLVNVFGVKLNVFSTKEVDDGIEKIFFGLDELDKFLSKCDILFCALPHTPKTDSLIKKAEYQKMVKKPYVINVSRADIFDKADLITALDENKIRGYASDVWWDDFEVTSSDFGKRNDVIISPHRAAYVTNTLPHLEDAIKNIANLYLGQDIINVINVEKYL